MYRDDWDKPLTEEVIKYLRTKRNPYKEILRFNQELDIWEIVGHVHRVYYHKYYRNSLDF